MKFLTRLLWFAVLGGSYAVTLQPASSAEAEPPTQLAPLDILEPVSDLRPDFHQDILPFLKRSCLACHNASTADAEVVLESPQAMLAYDPADPLIVPGNATLGKLLRVAAHRDEPAMPPEDNDVGATPLSPTELGLLKRWIELGAIATTTSPRDTPAVWQPLPADYRPILATTITAHGRFSICSRGNTLEVYDLIRGGRIARLIDPRIEAVHDGFSDAAHLDLVRAIASWNEGEWIASGGYRTVKLWRRIRKSAVVELPAISTPSVLAVASGGAFAVGNDRGGVVVQRDESSQPLSLASQGAAIVGLEFSTDSSRLVCVTSDGLVCEWGLATGDRLAVWKLAVRPQRAVVVSDQLLVTASDDRVVRLWNLEGATTSSAGESDVATRVATNVDSPAGTESSHPPPVALKVAIEFRGHTREISALTRIPGETPTFASGSIDGTIRKWNINTGQQTHQWVHGTNVQMLATSPDGTRIVSAGDDGIAKHWVADSEQPLIEQPIRFRDTHQRDHLEQGVEIAVANVGISDSTLAAARKQLTTDQEAHHKAEETLAAEDAKFAEQDAAVKDVRAGHEAAAAAAGKVAELKTLAERAIQVAEDFAKFSDELSGEEPGQATQPLWERVEGLVAAATKESEQAAAKVAALAKEVAEAEQTLAKARAARDDARLAVRRTVAGIEASQQVVERAANDRETMVRLQHAHEQQLAAWRKQMEHQPSVVGAEFSSDGGQLLVADAAGQVWLFDGESGSPLDAWQTHNGTESTLLAARFATATQFMTLSAQTQPPSLYLWNTDPAWRLERSIGSPTDPLSPLTDRVLALDVSPDGRWLAIGGGNASRNGQLVSWNLAEHRLEKEVERPHTDAVLAVAFSRDGKYLASGSADRMMRVFRMPELEFERLFEGHSHHVLDVAWRANGQQLATCSGDKTIKIWDFASGAQIRTILGGRKELTGVDFLGIGSEVVSASGDRTVRIHNADDGKQVRVFTAGTDYLYTCAATAAGDTIVTGGADRVLRVFTRSDGTERLAFETAAESR